MPTPHSSVNYVEPNYSSVAMENAKGSFQNWAIKDGYERAPRLEDYSITLNIEVELCGRINISQGEKITKDVLILSYTTKQNSDESVVNFLGGTKIDCGDANKTSVNYLTTNYADMYVGDLINYGTTEMIGIKDVQIDYQKSCVPIINIKFTDVRGLSLFQPTELSRTNSYQGIGGINADNVAQSFFQCFFRVPMPKFTITIKGFYGKPVTYEVLCDKFETSFNSETGDFDIDTRFIGYSYSFLTDIVMDALIAAPYSDYGGLEDDLNIYWKKNIDSGRFKIPNKENTSMVEMPTLYQIFHDIEVALKNTKVDITNVISEEEETHKEEIDELTLLKENYSLWYEKLFELLCGLYGKDFVFKFDDNGCPYELLILVNSKNNAENLSDEYKNFPDSFKEINKNLNSAINEYNNKEYKFKKIENVSEDFSKYRRIPLFNPLLNINGDIRFNGFDSSFNLPKTDTFNNIFNSQTNGNEAIDSNASKKSVLNTIYNNGNDEYLYCYIIMVDYRFIDARIKTLTADASRNSDEKTEERRIKEINKELFSKLKWYPSAENFAKIMMAHLETLMAQMYNCIDACKGRKASELGVSESNLDADISNDSEVPPFPRVFKDIQGDDGITTREDTWVGEFSNTRGFAEVDFINGLFNGADSVSRLYEDDLKANEEMNRAPENFNETEVTIPFPLTSFDLYIDKTPYGDSYELSNDDNGYVFLGLVAIRMFNILGINHFRKEFGSSFFLDNAEKIGKIEAKNFHETTSIRNGTILNKIRNDAFDEDNFIKVISSGGTDMPWGEKPLFSKGNNVWLFRYKADSYNNYIYPIQNISFENLNKSLEILNQGQITTQDGDISLYTAPDGFSYSSLPNSKDFGFGTTLILDDLNKIDDFFNNSNIKEENDYNKIFNEFKNAFSLEDNQINADEYNKLIIPDDDNFKSLYSINGEDIQPIGSQKNYRSDFLSYSKGGGFSSLYRIAKAYGISEDNGSYYINSKKSFYEKRNLKNNIILNDNNKTTTVLLLFAIMVNVKNIGIYLKKNKTVSYLPKIAVLQIGAILYAVKDIKCNDKDKIREEASKLIPVGRKDTYPDELFEYIASLNPLAKYQYVKYFFSWLEKDVNFGSRFTYPNHYEVIDEETLLKDMPFVRKATDELFKAVCVVRLSVNHYSNQTASNYAIPEGIAKNYFKGFIKGLRDIYYGEEQGNNENNSVVQLAKDAKKTTNDMKKELYRYLKQVYDKWIPMSSFSDWKLESFFIGDNGEEMGHKFYFIDSYYNDIGQKLIINPKILAEKIETLLNNKDINSMLLGFMADMYSANKAMFMTIQNFADLKKEHSMDEMFVPMSFNSIQWDKINKYSSFVVVYPYQASRNLDIPNSEYENDGFMLNDEFETPVAIKSKNTDKKGQYKIPAFGVSYGKQYQSYFKKVNIDMKSPIATEQSIKAKHSILRRDRTNGEKAIVSQDLYDVYASQSYTCNVEMMGCAWVQPLMYFVLLNVPMFRGSYMIMRVKHSIRPGDMTTTFTGCRMANVSNSLVEDIFTDSDFDASNSSYFEYEDRKQLLANFDNDCPYKIYPLWDSSTVQLSGDAKKDGVAILNKLIGLGYNEWAAAGIVGNMYIESYDYKNTKQYFKYDLVVEDDSKSSKGTSGGLCMWRNGYLEDLANKKTTGLGQNKTIIHYSEEARQTYSSKLNANGLDSQLEYLKATMTPGGGSWVPLNFADYNNSSLDSKSPKSCASEFQKKYERPAKIDSKRGEAAEDFYQAYKSDNYISNSQPTDKNPNDKKDVTIAFFDAVNKSALATPSIGVELSKDKSTEYYVRITQNNGNNDKLHIVFDMILNSEYFDHVQQMWWVYPNGGMETEVPPTSIYCKVVLNPDINKDRGVWIIESKKDQLKTTITTKIPTEAGSCNTFLLKSLAKRRAKVGDDGKFNKEVPQLTTDGIKELDKYMPKDCNTLVSTINGSGSLEGYNGNVKPNTRLYTLLDVEHNGYALDYMDSQKLGHYKLMDARVYGKKAYKQCCTSGPTTWYKRIGVNLVWWKDKGVATSEHVTTRKWFKGNGFNLVWYGHLSDAERLPTSSFCPGDVATFHVYDSSGKATSHGAMWTGKDWRSDCIQKALSCYPGGSDRDGEYSVCIWRMPSLVSEGLGINNTPDLT